MVILFKTFLLFFMKSLLSLQQKIALISDTSGKYPVQFTSVKVLLFSFC